MVTWYILRFLPKDQHVIIPDLPGHGATDRIKLKEDIYAELTDRLYEFVRLVGLNKKAFHIVGLSMGGALSICFAAKYPHLIAAASFVCPGIATPNRSKMIRWATQLFHPYVFIHYPKKVSPHFVKFNLKKMRENQLGN